MYTLERLVVDMKPLKFKTKELAVDIKDNCFLINMECYGGEQLYRVPFDLSSHTRITEVDLSYGSEYFKVNMIVKTSCQLDISDRKEADDVDTNHNEDTNENETDKEAVEENNNGYDNILYLDPSFSTEIAGNTILL